MRFSCKHLIVVSNHIWWNIEANWKLKILKSTDMVTLCFFIFLNTIFLHHSLQQTFEHVLISIEITYHRWPIPSIWRQVGLDLVGNSKYDYKCNAHIVWEIWELNIGGCGFCRHPNIYFHFPINPWHCYMLSIQGKWFYQNVKQKNDINLLPIFIKFD